MLENEVDIYNFEEEMDYSISQITSDSQVNMSTDPNDFCGNNLPIDIISHIMRFLPLADRISSSLTCHQWYEAGTEKRLHDNEVVFLYENLSMALKYLAPSVHSANLPKPPFQHFTFRDVEVKSTGDMRFFWPRFGAKVKSISLQDCEITEKALCDIFQLCPLLESLNLTGCSELFMSGQVLENVSIRPLVSLKQLGIMHNRFMSDAILNRFVAFAPNLQFISLNGCAISYSEAVYTRFYPESVRQKIEEDIKSGTIPTDVANNVLTFQNILNILRVRAHIFKGVAFGTTVLNQFSLKALASISPNLKLERLNLSSCFQLVGGLEEVTAKHANSMKFLDLSYCSRISESSLAHIHKLTSLTYLDLRNCTGIHSSIVEKFKVLVNLQHLNLSNCSSVFGPSLVTGICGLNRLRHLYLNNIPSLDSSSLSMVVTCLENLETLHLSNCRAAVTDELLASICRFNLSLRSLNLEHCSMVCDGGLTGTHLPELSFPKSVNSPTIHLGSRSEQAIVDEAKRNKEMEEGVIRSQKFIEMSNNLDVQFGISALTKLESLNLSNCPRVTDVSVKFVFKFKQLKELRLSRCMISDVSLQSLAEFCPSLQILDVSLNPCITDEGIIYLNQLRRLKVLNIRSCVKLGDSSLESLMMSSSPLKNVDIQGCISMSGEMVARFSQWLRHPVSWSNPRKNKSFEPPLPPSMMFLVSDSSNC